MRTGLPNMVACAPVSPPQVARLYKYLSHNMGAVDFWLATCVFPADTQQYPGRLACNPWHLAHNCRGATVGFSGTKDNHRLLPLHVQQSEPQYDTAAAAALAGGASRHGAQAAARAAAGLKSTDGKMLDRLLATRSYTSLEVGAEVSPASVCCTPSDHWAGHHRRIRSYVKPSLWYA